MTSFTPSLPKLVAVEIELVVANPGPSADTLTMKLIDPTGRPVAIVSKMVQTTDAKHALFVFPEGGVEVSFNGPPLLRETRSTFLFKTFGLSAHTSFAAFNPSL